MLVLPAAWPNSEPHLSEPGLSTIEVPVDRAGNVNRHRYRQPAQLAGIIRQADPDVLDIHEEPFSVAAAQWLKAAPAHLTTVMYTAQNIDKRWPPPFHGHEQRAYRRISALYPCSSQAAAVARGKGFDGVIEVIPLGYDPAVYYPGEQSLTDGEITLGLFGRLVPEKGARDAVQVLAHLNNLRPTRLVVIGSGPEAAPVAELAASLGVRNRVELLPWLSPTELADVYRKTHVVLVPSRATPTWAEQFGRVIVEAQASGAVVAGYASGSIPEVAGASAVLVPELAAEELARKLGALLSDQDAFEQRRAEGLKLAGSRTWTQVAERQANLYRRAHSHGVPRLEPRGSVSRRAAARVEFGSPAWTPAGERPFALPLLRRGGSPAALLARAIDTAVAIRDRRRA